MVNKNVCVSAHVYDVVELPDGTRFLDVCTPETPDDKCRFTVVSLWEDRDEVGELKRYRDMDVRVRGIVQPMHGRAGMVLSHSRQFYGGPPKFKPNPLLARGFNADVSRPPVNDPNLRSQGVTAGVYEYEGSGGKAGEVIGYAPGPICQLCAKSLPCGIPLLPPG